MSLCACVTFSETDECTKNFVFERKNTMSEDRYIMFSVAIDQAAKNLQRLKHIRMEKYGLRAVHVTCLIRLGRSPEGLTGTELSEICEVDKSLISRVLSDLIENGFADYEKTEKIYRKRIQLTDLGRTVVDEMRDVMDATVNAIRTDVSEEDLDAFYRTLHLIDRNIRAQFETESKKR